MLQCLDCLDPATTARALAPVSCQWLVHRDFSLLDDCFSNMGVSIDGGSPKWMLTMENPMKTSMYEGY